jgi:hypothetical protein
MMAAEMRSCEDIWIRVRWVDIDAHLKSETLSKTDGLSLVDIAFSSFLPAEIKVSILLTLCFNSKPVLEELN